MVDLGVCFDAKLSFREHIHAKINKAYMMLHIIKRNLNYRTVPTFALIVWLDLIWIIVLHFGHQERKHRRTGEGTL